MNERNKKFIMSILLFVIVQYVPATALTLLPFLLKGNHPSILWIGIVAIVTSLVYIPLMKIEKLKNKVLPKLFKFIMTWNIVGGILFVIIGITVMR